MENDLNFQYESLEEILQINYDFNENNNEINYDRNQVVLTRPESESESNQISNLWPQCIAEEYNIQTSDDYNVPQNDSLNTSQPILEVSNEVIITSRRSRGRPKSLLSEDMKRLKQKEINKKSAQKYRNKVKVLDNTIEESVKILMEKKTSLKKKVKSLENETKFLKAELAKLSININCR